MKMLLILSLVVSSFIVSANENLPQGKNPKKQGIQKSIDKKPSIEKTTHSHSKLSKHSGQRNRKSC